MNCPGDCAQCVRRSFGCPAKNYAESERYFKRQREEREVVDGLPL